jgi:hypothetical protein
MTSHKQNHAIFPLCNWLLLLSTMSWGQSVLALRGWLIEGQLLLRFPVCFFMLCGVFVPYFLHCSLLCWLDFFFFFAVNCFNFFQFLLSNLCFLCCCHGDYVNSLKLFILIWFSVTSPSYKNSAPFISVCTSFCHWCHKKSHLYTSCI